MPRFTGTWKRYIGLSPRWWDRFSNNTNTADVNNASILSAATDTAGTHIIAYFDKDINTGVYTPTVKVNGVDDVVTDVQIVDNKMTITITAAIIPSKLITISMTTQHNVNAFTDFPVVNESVKGTK